MLLILPKEGEDDNICGKCGEELEDASEKDQDTQTQQQEVKNHPGIKREKPFYRKGPFIVLTLIMIIGIITATTYLGSIVEEKKDQEGDKEQEEDKDIVCPEIDRIETMVYQGPQSENKVVCDSVDQSTGRATPSSNVFLNVRVIAENGRPMKNLEVEAEGAGVTAVGITNESGMIPKAGKTRGGFKITDTVYLPPNVDTAKITITAEIPGIIGGEPEEIKETTVWVVRV